MERWTPEGHRFLEGDEAIVSISIEGENVRRIVRLRGH